MPEPFHILIAEDEVLAAMALEDFLSLRGFRVSVAGNGIEALERFAREKIDALVTDLRMPRMDGHALIREIRQRDAELPVVVMTGYLTHDSDLTHDRWKPLEIFSKPVNPRTIHATLQRMLGMPPATADA
ncbi:response regulator [Azospirillum picis]|uniref:DNA-binding NtrC family response regulator n=1 Tax=Azospirillum picis TaxID=488438 RepID=A0ABU0MG69_9PROT|nr:response regulator [Azospirillum picis]MBP2298518.1 DNA-binding NtrC family response regulator [Azospirillum picis]MDQ0532433.1 DNA-binding NtrC family response regulator [Azospirillum picis]